MKGQSWNPKGLTSAFSLFTKPSLFIPQLAVDNIARIDFRALKKAGVQAVCFDKDNTLTAPFAVNIHPPFEAAWKECIDSFGSNNVIIVSNSAGSNNDVGFKEVCATRIEEALAVKVLRHTEKKPGGTQDLLNHFPTLRSSQIAVVGDRVMTDVVYGNSVGAFTILTTKIVTEVGDNPFAIRIRRFENRVLVPVLKWFGVCAVSHDLGGGAVTLSDLERELKQLNIKFAEAAVARLHPPRVKQGQPGFQKVKILFQQVKGITETSELALKYQEIKMGLGELDLGSFGAAAGTGRMDKLNDVMSKVSGSLPIVGIAWSFASIGLLLYKTAQETNEQISSILEAVNTAYERLVRLERIGDEAILRETLASFVDLIVKVSLKCVSTVVAHLNLRGVSRFWTDVNGTLSGNLSNLSKELRQTVARLDTAILDTVLANTHAALIGINHLQHDVDELLEIARKPASLFPATSLLQMNLLQLLKPVEIYDRVVELLEPIQPVVHRRGNPREWILEEVVAWVRDEGGPNVFHVEGCAGTGKSVVAALVVDHEEIKEERDVCGFFFQYAKATSNHTHAMVTTLICQIAKLVPAVRETTIVHFSDNPDYITVKTTPPKLLWQKPMAELRQMTRPMLICIDALDECVDTTNHLNDALAMLQDYCTRFPIKILVTSRPASKFTNTLRNPVVTVLDKESNARDLEPFIKGYIAAHWSDFEVDQVEPLASSLANAADGLFTWVRQALDVIDAEPWDKAAKARQLIESGILLDQLFLNALQRIHVFDDAVGLEIFHNVASAVLCLREPVPESAFLEVTGVKHAHKAVQAMSPLLSPRDHSDTDPVAFYHKSVPEFLVSVNAGRYRVDGRVANSGIAKKCISIILKTRLSSKDFLGHANALVGDLGELEEGGVTPAVKYAFSHWIDHFDSGVDTRVDGEFERFVDRFGAAGLSAAVKKGNSVLVRAILGVGGGRELLQEADRCRFELKMSPLLYRAVQQGRVEVCQALVEEGQADVNAVGFTPFNRGGECGNTVLHVAVKSRMDALVQVLLEAGADYAKEDDFGLSAFSFSVGSTRLVMATFIRNEKMGRLVEEMPPLSMSIWLNEPIGAIDQDLVNQVFVADERRTALHYAAEKGRGDVVDQLIAAGATVDVLDSKGMTPFYMACEFGYATVAKSLLVEHHALATVRTRRKWSALHVASANGHNEIVELLLTHHASVHTITEDHSTPLFLACRHGHFAIAERLLAASADINACTEEGKSPLFIACSNGHREIAELLLQRKAQINARSVTQSTALFIASQNGHAAVVELLLGFGAEMHTNELDQTPLYIASQNGHREVVAALIRAGADVNSRDGKRWTALHVASQNGFKDCAELLIHAGADVNLVTSDHLSPLHLASGADRAKVVLLLLKHEADVNGGVARHKTPLHYACKHGRRDIAQVLLEKGALVNALDSTSDMPIHWACRAGFLEVVQLLVGVPGVVVDMQNRKQESPLYLACLFGHARVAEVLLEKGAPMDQTDVKGFTPLHASAVGGHVGCVLFLVSAGARVDSRTAGQCTALHLASGAGWLEVVEVLIASNADINARDEYQNTPLFFAYQGGKDEVAVFLIECGAMPLGV
ncbi:hypothetical protein HDU98_006587 [Podochytrium sp. JEL0797]|nr:hypothetical protein HDU98_006587 [Podochytrium sp. JEL0797]